LWRNLLLAGLITAVQIVGPFVALADNWDTIHNKWKTYILDAERNRYYETAQGEDLGWLEAPILQGLAYGYRASGDRMWLDKLVTHFDVMVNRLAPNPEAWDDYLGWYHVGGYTTDGRTQFDFIVSEGQILHAVALFIESIRNDPALHPGYLAKANTYLNVIETQLIPKWDARGCWRALQDGAGVYTFQNNPNHFRQDMSLPHNQYGEMAKAILVLHAITQKAEYRDKATRMCRFFKNNMTLNGDHYEWHYWDPAGPWDRWPDGSLKHGVWAEWGNYRALDIALIVNAHREQIVFDATDAARVTRTAQTIWNDATFVHLAWLDEAERLKVENKFVNEAPHWGWLNTAPLYLWIAKSARNSPPSPPRNLRIAGP
jgi:hypothetical protein